MRHRLLSTWPSLAWPQWRRRWFLAALVSSGWLGAVARAEAQVSVKSRGGRGGRAQTPSQRAKQRATPRSTQPATLRVFIDHLIPADDLTPAASTLQVHQRVWAEAQQDPDGVRLVVLVCRWLDGYGDRFDRLSEAERETLVAWMAKAPWESPQRRFFHWVRERAFTHYYSQPASWRGLPVQRPPQPMGHVLD